MKRKTKVNLPLKANVHLTMAILQRIKSNGRINQMHGLQNNTMCVCYLENNFVKRLFVKETFGILVLIECFQLVFS